MTALEGMPRLVTGRIVVISNVNVEHAPGRAMLSTDQMAFQEGQGGILAFRAVRRALAVARFGLPALLVGRISDDLGPRAIPYLTAQGVDWTGLKPTAGSDLVLTPGDISGAEDSVRQAALCLLELQTPPTALKRAVELCEKNGVETLVTAEPPGTGWTPAPSVRADILCCDEGEANQLTGLSAAKSPRAVAAALAKRGFRSIVLRLAERGAYVFSPEGESAVPGFAVEPVNPAMAADAFVAALAVALVWGWRLHEAIRFANGAAALADTRTGVLSALPALDEVEAFLAGQL